MSNKGLFAGELNAPIELFEWITAQNEVSESIKSLQSLGVKFAKRMDISGTEQLDGRLISLSVCKYIVRYDATLLREGTKYVVRDQDGDYDINSVATFGQKRNKFIEIKCSKRGAGSI